MTSLLPPSSPPASESETRVGRADGGVGGHGRHVGRQGDERPGAGRSRAGRGDIHDGGNGVAEEFLDDFLGGIEQAAGGVKLNDEAGVLFGGGLVDGAGYVGGGGGPDRSVNFDQANLPGPE